MAVMRQRHATGACDKSSSRGLAGRYRRGWPGGECLESRAGYPGRPAPQQAPRRTPPRPRRQVPRRGFAPGAGGGGDHGGTEIPAVPTRAPGTEHASQTSQLVRMTQPGGDRPPPAPSSVKEGKHLMLARHRQSLILQAVRSDGSARVSDLTQRLGVSDMTIRRDLEVLARDGLVEKVHGGAVLPGSPASHEPGFEAKLVLE